MPIIKKKGENEGTDYRKDDNYYPLVTWGWNGGRGIGGSICSFIGSGEMEDEACSAERCEKTRLDYVAKTRADEYKKAKEEGYDKEIADDSVKILTEFPFSFYENNKSEELKEIEQIRLKKGEAAEDGAAWINGTADLFFLYKDKAIVFDYKSDLADYIEDRETFERTLEERYTGQLMLYRYAINKLYGIDKGNIELRLLYFKDYGDGLRVYEKAIE